MKKILIFLVLGLFIFSSNCLAISTIDYNASINSPIYRDGEQVAGDELTANFSIGKSFQKSFGKVRLGGSISGLSLVGESTGDLTDHLSLSGSIDWFDAGHLRGSLNTSSLRITYSDKILNENLSYSIGNKWNFEKETNTQRLSLGYRKDLPNQKGTLSANTSWSVQNFQEISNASVTVSYSRSFHHSNGQALNTSIISEVYLEDGSPISGVTTTLLVDGEAVKRVKTSQGGTASFGELDPGTYTVQLAVSSLPQGLELSSSREIEIDVNENEIKKARFKLISPEIEERTTFSGGLDDD